VGGGGVGVEEGERCGMQAWKPGGEGTTRLFYVVAAEEFVEAARIFGDFFTGWPN
jgi:hypothetical protein